MRIPKSVERCISILTCNGYKGYMVGGCVRDSILGKQPNDWDVCTSATPKEIKNLFKDFKTIDTGIQHGTVTVIIDKELIEVTTFRIDGEYSDNRRPDKVTFTDEVKYDLSRRDFTINAMAYNSGEGIIDYFYGREDINNKIIRCVGAPEKRFQEDALRIMRALRFMAQLNYRLEKETWLAIENTKGLIKNIAVERIATELNKLILADIPNEAIRIILELNLFSLIIPELKTDISTEGMDEKAKDTYGEIIKNCPKILAVRLSVLLNYLITGSTGIESSMEIISNEKDIGGEKVSKADIGEYVLKTLRYDTKTIKEVKILMDYYDVDIPSEKYGIKIFLKDIGENLFRQLLAIKAAENMAYIENKCIQRINKYENVELILNEIAVNSECYSKKALKVNGKDLIELGIREGALIGKILDMLLDEVIYKPELNNEYDLKNYAKGFISSKIY
ncbi:MAG: polynucleotide adenylyltransferase [Clostridium sp.]